MMDMDDKLVGFLYAVVGAAIALLGKWAIDAITRRSEKSNHAAYLCVRVVCELDRFATGCAAVAQDFGPEPDDETSEMATVRDRALHLMICRSTGSRSTSGWSTTS